MASTSQRCQQQPVRIAAKTCRQSHATPVCRSVEPADRAPAVLCALLASAGAFVPLQKQYLLKHTVREISFYLDFKPNENINNHGLLQCNLDT